MPTWQFFVIAIIELTLIFADRLLAS